MGFSLFIISKPYFIMRVFASVSFFFLFFFVVVGWSKYIFHSSKRKGNYTLDRHIMVNALTKTNEIRSKYKIPKALTNHFMKSTNLSNPTLLVKTFDRRLHFIS